MENESPLKSDYLAHPVFDTDLEPLYALTEPQYQAIINHLSNLVVVIIRHVQQTSEPGLAQQIADCAHEILLDYDDDIAEGVLRAAHRQEDVIEIVAHVA